MTAATATPEPEATILRIVLLDDYPIEVDLSEWKHIVDARELKSASGITILEGRIPGRHNEVALVYGSDGHYFAGLIVEKSGPQVAAAVFSVCSTFEIPHKIGVAALSRLKATQVPAFQPIHSIARDD